MIKVGKPKSKETQSTLKIISRSTLTVNETWGIKLFFSRSYQKDKDIVCMSTRTMFKELTILILLPYSIAVFYKLCEEAGEKQVCREKILLTDCVLHCQKQKLVAHFSEGLNICCCQAHGMNLLHSKDKVNREVFKGIHDCDFHKHNGNNQPFTMLKRNFLRPLHFPSL